MFGLSWWKIAGIGLAALLIGGFLYGYFKQQAAIQAELQQTKQDLGEEQQARKDLQASFDSYQDEVQTKLAAQRAQMQELSRSYDTIRRDTQEIGNILSEHDLTKLSRAKPGLIENRIDAGTQAAFDELMSVTREFARDEETTDATE